MRRIPWHTTDGDPTMERKLEDHLLGSAAPLYGSPGWHGDTLQHDGLALHQHAFAIASPHLSEAGVDRPVMRGEALGSEVETLAKELARLRTAGCVLAERASHVLREYDGLHRLAAAVGDWYAALATEFGRPGGGE